MNIHATTALSPARAPFLPLAFRMTTAFALLVLHLALPVEPGVTPPGESLYVAILLAFFAEAVWEMGQSSHREGQLFATPSRPWIHLNLVLSVLLVATLVCFQGITQERFATIYIFPVLASAFYLEIGGIVAVAVGTSLIHTLTAMSLLTGLLPAFGHSAEALPASWSELAFPIGFPSLQVFGTTLVVILIRKHLENLSQTLDRSQAAVGELSALYQHVFESLAAGLVTLDMEGRITSANPAAEQILGMPLAPGTDAGSIGLLDRRAMQALTTERRFERPFQLPDGSSRMLGGTLAHIRDAGGAVRGHLLLFQDLTELKALEERTRLSERMAMVGGLAASLAHELRNPMASIQGCVQLLQRGQPAQLLLDRMLNILQREGERVSAIVTDFLEFAKPRDLHLQALWLPSLMEDVLASWETDPRCATVPLMLDPAPAVWIQGDPLTVHQVFTNLLSNARKAVRHTPSPLVSFHFHPSPDTLALQVRDNGCGMTAQQLETLFMPFESGFEEGTGLGMSLVYRFIQQMDWSISVQSEAGNGTTVTLSIPRAEEGLTDPALNLRPGDGTLS